MPGPKPPDDLEQAAYEALCSLLVVAGWVMGTLRRPAPGARQFYDFDATLGLVRLHIEIKASTGHTAPRKRRSTNPKWMAKATAASQPYFAFSTNAPSFMHNRLEDSMGVHVIVFCCWEGGCFEFTPVAVAPPLLGVPDDNSDGGKRLHRRDWSGSKERLATHYGVPGNLVDRFLSWAEDVQDAIAALPKPSPKAKPKATPKAKPKAKPSKRGLAPPKAGDELARLAAFMVKRGRRAPGVSSD